MFTHFVILKINVQSSFNLWLHIVLTLFRAISYLIISQQARHTSITQIFPQTEISTSTFVTGKAHQINQTA